MENLSKFCTCTNTKCSLHPTNHDKGCAPCIGKHLKSKKVPGCFFDLLENGGERQSESFAEFARLVQANQ